MNARSQVFEYSLEVAQAEEVCLALFHTLLVHRTQGKITRREGSSLLCGSLGFEDVDCDLVDFSYVRCASPSLCRRVGAPVRTFVDELQRADAKNGQISMEFYKRRRGSWLNADATPWEVWTVRLSVTRFATEYDRQLCREALSEVVAESVINLAESLSRGDLYVPTLPNCDDIDLIYETEFPDVQPFLFRIMHRIDDTGAKQGYSLRKLIRDTLSL